MKRLPHIDRLTLRLGLAISLVVVGGLSLGFHLTWLVYREEMLAASRLRAESEARLVRLALRHQMLESDDRSLIDGMVKSVSSDGSTERIMVLDRRGKVKFASDPRDKTHKFKLSDPTCQVCHQHPPAQRERTVLLDLHDGAVLRAVQPIVNRLECQECHDAKNRLIGILIVDVPVGATMSNMQHSVRRLALGTALVGLVLIGGIAIAFRRFLLRRLYRFEEVARAIAGGDLQQRVPEDGNDAVTRLERAFNQMADSVVGLLGRVEAQSERLRRVMDSVDDGMVVLDRDVRVVAANQAFMRRFPNPEAKLLGMACRDAVCAGSGQCNAEDCPGSNTFDRGRVHTSIRTRIDAAGLTRHEEVRASPLFSADGGIERVVEVWRDITDRRSAEARLAEYQRLASVGMLASGISHELNTPLASIGTCLEAIERIASEPTPELAQLQRYAQIASEQVRRCGGITKQFMHLARGRSPDLEILDLPATVQLVARLVGPTAQVAGVTVTVDAAGDVPAIAASSSSVQQVLLNLLLNAVEASPKAGEVRVTFAVLSGADGGWIEVHVADTGMGIAPADLERIYEPFFSRRSRGSGLGLFVSLNLARGWGGDIHVVQTAVGAGTTFAARFPRQRAVPNAQGST